MTAKKCTKKAGSTCRVVVFCLSNLLLFWRSRCRRLRLPIVNKASCKRTQHCWMLHVVSDVGRCCTVLHTTAIRTQQHATLGSLSKDVFERRTSTGSEAFSLFICLDTTKFVLLSFFSPMKTIYLRVSTKPQPNAAKSQLPVDVRRSKTLLLKLPIVGATMLGVVVSVCT